MQLTLDQVRQACPRAPPLRLAALLAPINASLIDADISSPERAAMYLAQLGHESSDLTCMVENLSYSEEGLMRVFPRHFRPDEAKAFEYRAPAIGSRVYADRMGNGDEQGGDGWRFRGRGAIQLTGANSYRDCGRALGIDLLARPDLAATSAYCFAVAAYFWRARDINRFAERGDVEGANRAINGGLTGIADRIARFNLACTAVGALSLYPLTQKVA